MADNWIPMSEDELSDIEARQRRIHVGAFVPRLVAELRRTREALAKLQAESLTVSHLRSVVQRTAEGRDAGHGLSDAEAAGRVRMLTQGQLDHEMICVMGRDRIIALSEALREAREDTARLEHAMLRMMIVTNCGPKTTRLYGTREAIDQHRSKAEAEPRG